MRRRGYTLMELIFTAVVLILAAAVILPFLTSHQHRPAWQMVNSSQLRGQHQGLVIYAQSNNSRLPGMGTDGEILPASLDATGSKTQDGSVAASRYWILLNGSFIAPPLLLNPKDNLALWTTGQLTTANHSYAMLRITSTNADLERREEWADNANGAAVLISDRNIGPDSTDAKAQSLWTTTPGDWRGGVAWGDNHVSFEMSHRLTTTTIYGTNTHYKTTNDNLFATGPVKGVTEASTRPSANAFMTPTN